MQKPEKSSTILPKTVKNGLPYLVVQEEKEISTSKMRSINIPISSS
jgi:hypothetical protein